MVHETHDVKNLLDLVSLGAAAGAMAQIVPTAAALASLIWTVIRIGEWALAKWQARKAAKP